MGRAAQPPPPPPMQNTEQQQKMLEEKVRSEAFERPRLAANCYRHGHGVR
jgi:hypothetical protein